MTPTAELLASFVGGQAEIQNPGEEYLCRGEISKATIQGTEVHLEFAWMAKGEGFPPLPKRWVAGNTRPYDIDLQIYSTSDIGNGRICFNSTILGELATLFPPDGSKLDPTKVEGLTIQK
jgi:hypothetical protein